MTAPPVADKSRFVRSRVFHGILLLLAFSLTCLTFVKESSLYQNEHRSWRKLVYLLGVHAYYPATLLLLVVLTFAIWRLRQLKDFSPLLAAVFFLLVLNFGLCAANNVLNFFEGRPIHSMHKGIGR